MTQVIIDPQPNVCEASITTLPPTLPNINKLRPHTLRVIGFLSLDIRYTAREYFLKYRKYKSY